MPAEWARESLGMATRLWKETKVQTGWGVSPISIVFPRKPAIRVAPYFPEPLFIFIRKCNHFHPLGAFPGITLRDYHTDRASMFFRERSAVPFIRQEHVPIVAGFKR